MSNYRRMFVPGGTYFFTCNTHKRKPILTPDLGRRCLREAILKIQQRHPFQIPAIVLIPCHWHWTLPRDDDRYSMRWSRIKEEFTERWLSHGGCEQYCSPSRRKYRLRGVWQKRFWEHTVRDQDDFERCVDYIHWNPRKHGLVRRVRDWPWSSFHRYVAAGQLDIDWGGSAHAIDWDAPEWGG